MSGQSNIIHEILDTPVENINFNDVSYQVKIINFLNEWLFYAEELIGVRPESSTEVLALRNVWVFPNDWMFIMPNDAPAVITHLTEEIMEDNPMFGKIMGDLFDSEQWEFQKAVNGWTRAHFLAFEDDPTEMLTMINRLTILWGEPQLVLPLLDHVERYSDDEEYYREEIQQGKLDGEDVDSKEKTLKFLLALKNVETFQQHIPWRLKLSYGDDYIAQWSAVGRIYQLSVDLEDTGVWMVDLDEHCGACSGGEHKSFKEQHPDLDTYYSFITWGQSSKEEWFPDGSAEVRVYLTEEEIETIQPFLKKYGFPTIDEDESLKELDHVVLCIDGYSHF